MTATVQFKKVQLTHNTTETNLFKEGYRQKLIIINHFTICDTSQIMIKYSIFTALYEYVVTLSIT